jgi:hypothetical protein
MFISQSITEHLAALNYGPRFYKLPQHRKRRNGSADCRLPIADFGIIVCVIA